MYTITPGGEGSYFPVPRPSTLGSSIYIHCTIPYKPVVRAIELSHTQLANMSFDVEILDLTAVSY